MISKVKKIGFLGWVLIFGVCMMSVGTLIQIMADFSGHPLAVPPAALNVKSHGNGWYSWDLDGHSFLQDVRHSTVTRIK